MKETDHILLSLRRISRAFDLHSRQLVKSTGLTAPQLVVLRALSREGPLSPSLIARHVSLSPATITSIMDRLLKLGLVEREKRASDRRQVEIRLTEKGKAAFDNAPELLRPGFLDQYWILPDWERQMILAGLSRLADLMEKDAPELALNSEADGIEQNAADPGER